MFIAAFIFGVFMTGVKAFITGEGGDSSYRIRVGLF